jgi:xanthine dehydrogenase YagS FAD-binding subunit
VYNFDYTVAEKANDVFAADGAHTMLIAGGTELLNWLRLGIASPTTLIDVEHLDGLHTIEQQGSRLFIGALVTLNELGEHPLVRQHAGALAEACLKAASAQVRNRATIGGNVLQKTRCAYFRAEGPLPWGCNKRAPGSGCAARDGINERHAIFGWTDACVAVQPSDPLVALAALDAIVELRGPTGHRTLPIGELHLTQEEAAAQLGASVATEAAALLETRLKPGELISGYHLPITSGLRSTYVKVRERASYEYALVSAAAAVELVNGRISKARVVLGSVAQKPWRLPEAESRLIGLPPQRDAVLPVLHTSLQQAKPLTHNAYKVAMAAGAAARAIVEAGAMNDSSNPN